MDKKSFIVLLLFIIGLIAIVLISGNKYQRPTGTAPIIYTEEEKIFLNYQCPDLKCTASAFLNCRKAEYVNNGKRIAIYGLSNDMCHVENIEYDCYLPKSNLTIPLLNQLLGNEEGLTGVISQYCK